MTNQNKLLRCIIRKTLKEGYIIVNESPKENLRYSEPQCYRHQNCCAEFARTVLMEIDYPKKKWDAVIKKVLGEYKTFFVWQEARNKKRVEILEHGGLLSIPTLYPDHKKREGDGDDVNPEYWSCCGEFGWNILREIGYEGNWGKALDRACGVWDGEDDDLVGMFSAIK